MKIYKKRGNKNYKERKLLRDLEPYIEKRVAEDPNFANEVIPATNYNELQQMHQRYIVEDVAFEEKQESNQEETKENMAKDTQVEDVEFEETEETCSSGCQTRFWNRTFHDTAHILTIDIHHWVSHTNFSTGFRLPTLRK